MLKLQSMEHKMPLNKDAKPGSKKFGENIAIEERAGKKPQQAIAIAFSESGEYKKKGKHLNGRHKGHSDN